MKRRISRRFQPTMTPGLDQLESRQLLSSGFAVVSSPTVTGSGLNAVSAVSPTDIWAVGSQPEGSTSQAPLIENFNGTSSGSRPKATTTADRELQRDDWSQVTSPALSGFADLNGVSALSSKDVWAVGSDNGDPLVEFFNGTSWSVQTSPTISGGAARSTR